MRTSYKGYTIKIIGAPTGSGWCAVAELLEPESGELVTSLTCRKETRMSAEFAVMALSKSKVDTLTSV